MTHKNDSWADALLKLVGGVFAGVGIVFIIGLIAPLLYTIGGYFSGWALYKVFPFAGIWVANGFTRLGIEMAPSSLPVVCAALGCVGPFFKASFRTVNK